MTENALLLAVDTCGPAGSIALGRVRDAALDLLGEAELAGGEYAALLVQAIADLLRTADGGIADLAGIVVVSGPGSFTGIRVGLATVKALAESLDLPVVTVSRLTLLAHLAKAECAVLDAHRGQLYCGMYGDGEAREMLLTAGEINSMGGLTGERPGRVAVCEESVAQLLEELCGEPELVRVAAPTAVDALRFSLGRWRAGEFADVATLDGFYLRGADAKVAARLD